MRNFTRESSSKENAVGAMSRESGQRAEQQEGSAGEGGRKVMGAGG